MLIHTTPSGQFQFHKGTIKTSFISVVTAPQARFQFHKGTIKTLENYESYCKM